MLTQDWGHGKASVLLNLDESVLRLVLGKWQKYLLFYFFGSEGRGTSGETGMKSYELLSLLVLRLRKLLYMGVMTQMVN